MMIKKILIGIDDSKHAAYAAEFGFDLARKFNAQVGLVNIVSPVIISQLTGADPIIGMPLQGTGIEETELLDIQKSQSENIVEQTIKKFAGDLPVTHFSEYGSTADGIISCSKEFNADLIVVGTHNRTGLDRLFMGSVAEHVVRHSTVPVLVVPLKSESQ
ncbi:universal stress protein [Mucilaginibacter gotjawali]|uniref:Nucleotide-binding universal stress UspA family protein n=2 Tax=Mucilaginibacter gotjawali TaxID=1550579 RepID=A0A839SNG4_9SPHI|nr:universal stress protein [Mucilaginibacter gotjawali]MBB3059172.1 nucleotide-binding universal stress UspA family protein [Mucilaginibacter gotjawali]BAU52241.1 putative universal stress protein [Mucilaginibacter gotjawali]